jgi:phosphoenolpyruvate carboxylase
LKFIGRRIAGECSLPRGMKWVATCAAAGLPLAVACHGRTGHASPDDCRAIAEHYVDLAVRETPGASAMTPAQAAAVGDVKRDLKRAEPSYRVVQDHCASVSGPEVSCAIEAKTTRAWEACVHPPDGGR